MTRIGIGWVELVGGVSGVISSDPGQTIASPSRPPRVMISYHPAHSDQPPITTLHNNLATLSRRLGTANLAPLSPPVLRARAPPSLPSA